LKTKDGMSQQVQVLARFVPEMLTFERLTDLISDPRLAGQSWIGIEASSVFAFLNILPLLLARLNHSMITLLQRGYFVVDARDLAAILEEGVPVFIERLRRVLPACPLVENGKAVLATIDSLRGSLWPLRLGQVLRRSGPAAWVDVYAATNYLEAALEFPHSPGEAIANARAEHFEDSTQAAIDATAWAPPSNLRQLQRRQLRLQDKAVTDLDAVGAKGSTLLLVSCKSLIYSAAYDVGDHRTVRNAASTVEDAVKEWGETVARLSAAPRGDNYDFSGFADFLPVVCTPHAVYVPLGTATQELRPNLYAAMSLDELVAWLQKA
jgi:hypothetical protein